MNYRKIDLFFVILLFLELLAAIFIIVKGGNFLRVVLCIAMILATIYNWRKFREL